MAESAFAARAPVGKAQDDAPAPSAADRHEALERRPAGEAERGQARLLSRRAPDPQPVQRAAAPNRTGLPDRLKSGVEALSGVSLDGVKVHYNSAKPAGLSAHAFAQGSDIHLAPGQERHLPHEAWHVVQQAQGRARPTMQLKGGVSVNDDAGLEREADVMGARALQAEPLSPGAAVEQRSGAALVQLRNAGDAFTLQEAARLNPLPQVNNNPANLALLANGSAREAADLETLAQLQVGGLPPTIPDMLALEPKPLGRIQALVAAALPQVHDWAELRQLALLNRSHASLIQFALSDTFGPTPTLAQLVSLDSRPAQQLGVLYQLAQVVGWDDLGALASLTRSTDELAQLAALQIAQTAPTVADMAALDAVPLARIQALVAADLTQVHNWAELRQLALLNRPHANLIQFARSDAFGPAPTLAQLVSLDSRPAQQLGVLYQLAQVVGWDDLGALASLTRSTDELAQLAALQIAQTAPTTADMAALDAGPLVRIQALVAAHLPQIHNWAELRQLALLNRSHAHLIILANHLIAAQRPTLAQIVALDRFASAGLNTVLANDQIQTWDDVGQLEATGRSAQDIAGVAGHLVGNARPTLAQLLSGLGDIHEALMTQLHRMAAHLQPDLALLQQTFGVLPSMQKYMAILADISVPALVNQGYQNDVAIFRSYLSNSTNYNACFDGASRLVDSLGNEAAMTYQSDGGPRQDYDLANQAQRGDQLAQHLEAAAGAGVATIFRVHLAGHGFVLVVERNVVYLLETLAGNIVNDYGSLLMSIQRGTSFPIATVAGHIRQVTSDNAGQRQAASNAMGWNPIALLILQDALTVAPMMVVYWTGSALASRADLVQIFTDKIALNRREMLTRLGHDID
jgi:hypothetical protein